MTSLYKLLIPSKRFKSTEVLRKYFRTTSMSKSIGTNGTIIRKFDHTDTPSDPITPINTLFQVIELAQKLKIARMGVYCQIVEQIHRYDFVDHTHIFGESIHYSAYRISIKESTRSAHKTAEYLFVEIFRRSNC